MFKMPRKLWHVDIYYSRQAQRDNISDVTGTCVLFSEMRLFTVLYRRNIDIAIEITDVPLFQT